jgi:hypothetical protein
MARALTAAVESTTVIRIDGQGGVGWGRQLDIKRLDGTASGLDRNAPRVDGAGSVAVAGSAGRVEAIAAYVAKYATKTSAVAVVLPDANGPSSSGGWESERENTTNRWPATAI